MFVGVNEEKPDTQSITTHPGVTTVKKKKMVFICPSLHWVLSFLFITNHTRFIHTYDTLCFQPERSMELDDHQQRVLAEWAQTSTKNNKKLLEVAAEKGHTGLVQWLLKYVDRNAPKKDLLHTALWNACKRGHADIVPVLLSHKLNINFAKRDGYTLLMKASQRGHRGVVDSLIKGGADVNARTVHLQYTPLIIAANTDHLPVVEELIRNGADINGQSLDGITALACAAEQGNEGLVATLIKHGAHVNSKVPRWSPVSAASRNGSEHMVKYLIAHGADVNSKDASGITTLMEASFTGDKRMVELLISNGAIVNSQATSGEAALLIGSDHEKVVSTLLKHGASVNMKDRRGKTALLEAAVHFNKKVVRMLIEHGAAINPAILQARNEENIQALELLKAESMDVKRKQKLQCCMFIKAVMVMAKVKQRWWISPLLPPPLKKEPKQTLAASPGKRILNPKAPPPAVRTTPNRAGSKAPAKASPSTIKKPLKPVNRSL